MTYGAVEVVDEGGYEAAAVFAREWMSIAVPMMEQALGVRLDEPPLRILLTPTEVHARRFPVSEDQAAALEGPFDEGHGLSSPDSPSASASETYAHGVATRASQRLALGPNVPDGAPLICLDVPTLKRLAVEHEVSFEAMLARVLTHELAHILRGHIDIAHTTHGYVREGDAQRDAWQLLTDALASGASRLAAEARTAQVRLAAQQPGAYQKFGHGSPSTGRWKPTTITPTVWVLTTTRATPVLAQSETIETPWIPSAAFGSPQLGDRVVLVSQELAVGEWVIVGVGDVREVQSPADDRALDSMWQSGDRSARNPRWLHLRKQDRMTAVAPAPARLHNPKLMGKAIDDDRHRETWKSAEKVPLERALSSIAASRRAEFRRSLTSTRKEVEAAGGTMPDVDVDAWDPFRD